MTILNDCLLKESELPRYNLLMCPAIGHQTLLPATKRPSQRQQIMAVQERFSVSTQEAQSVISAALFLHHCQVFARASKLSGMFPTIIRYGGSSSVKDWIEERHNSD